MKKFNRLITGLNIAVGFVLLILNIKDFLNDEE